MRITILNLKNKGRSLIRAKHPELADLDAARKHELVLFQKAHGIKFRDLRLLNLAFVHRSVSNEVLRNAGGWAKQNNERLEFLGDAILGLVVADLLYSGQIDKNEGELAKIKAIVVSAETLAGIARELQIDALMILGKGEELSGGRNKKALLADSLEALFGALYIDSGFNAAYAFIKKCVMPEIERVLEKRGFQDYKSIFQEECQRLFHSYPKYLLKKRSGPEHERYFWVEVCVGDKIYGQGMGKNKKNAEQEAAKLALQTLKGG